MCILDIIENMPYKSVVIIFIDLILNYANGRINFVTEVLYICRLKNC